MTAVAGTLWSVCHFIDMEQVDSMKTLILLTGQIDFFLICFSSAVLICKTGTHQRCIKSYALSVIACAGWYQGVVGGSNVFQNMCCFISTGSIVILFLPQHGEEHCEKHYHTPAHISILFHVCLMLSMLTAGVQYSTP